MLAREAAGSGQELQHAFLKQLPARLGMLRDRGRALCGGWDINAIWLLADDARTLGDIAARFGAVAPARDLGELSETLSPLLDPAALPDDDTTTRIVALLDRLDADGAAAPGTFDLDFDAPQSAEVLIPLPADEDNGYPLIVTPPAEYWRRFQPETAPADVSPAIAALVPAAPTGAAPVAPATVPPQRMVPARTVTPTLEPPPAPEPAAPAVAKPPIPSEDAATPTESGGRRSVYHLTAGDALAGEVDQRLEARGDELTRLEEVDELKEMLAALPPELVIVDAAFEDSLEEIGALLKSARTRVSHRIWLVALSATADLGGRLRAMRAGCDAFVAMPSNANDVLSRIRELTEVEQTEPYRIMIVEDDRSQALFAESILRKSGMETLSVTEALAALDHLDTFHPDLILMDLYMPDCDGMELTALIREREAFISTPIVFLSGEHDTEKHFEALNAGGDDFLSKPIRPKHLISAVTNRVRRARQLRKRTVVRNPRDAVTGLYERPHLLGRIAELLAMEDAATRPGGLMLVEIEESSKLRERVGLSAYEGLLGSLGSFLASHVDARDIAARMGDAAFLVLNPDRDADALEAQAHNLRDRIARETFAAGGEQLRLGIVVGLCPFTAAVGDASAMLDAAESAAIAARAPGVGGVLQFTPPSAEAHAARNDLVEHIRRALDGDGFQLVFQPIVSLHGEEEEQFQALLRLRTEDGRVYAAAELVPTAERAGLIADVDRWVVRRCAAVAEERLRGGRVVRIFASQSLASIRDAERPDWIKQLVEASSVPGEQLSLEFRLNDAQAALAEAIAFASRVKQAGLTLTISGFEAGPGATQVLGELPVDFIKLSPRYAAAHDDAVRAELRDIVSLAHARGKRVIAPRVEDARSAATLWTAGVDYIQGNFVQQAGQELAYDFHTSAF